MSGFAEIIITAVAWLVEVSIYLARFAFAPLRFVFSRQYRVTMQQRWRGHPGRHTIEMIGGIGALLLFAGVLTWWVFIFSRLAQPSPHPSTDNLERIVIKKIRDLRDHRQ